MRRVAKADGVQSYVRRCQGVLNNRATGGFGSRQHQIRQSLAVQLQHLVADQMVDQRADARVKLTAIGQKRHQHADTERAGENLLRAHPQQCDVDHAGQRGVNHAIKNLQLLDRQRCVGLGHQHRLPCRLALALTREQLDRAHAANGFQQMGRLHGTAHDLLFGGKIQRAQPEQANAQIEQHRQHCHTGHRRAVDEHHGQCEQDEQAVKHAFNKSIGQHALNLVNCTDSGDDVTEVAFLKILQRQAQHVTHHIGSPLHAHRRIHHQQYPRARQRKSLLQNQQQQKSQGQCTQQISVARDKHMIENPLHQQRADQHQHLQHQRQQQHLRQRRPEA